MVLPTTPCLNENRVSTAVCFPLNKRVTIYALYTFGSAAAGYKEIINLPVRQNMGRSSSALVLPPSTDSFRGQPFVSTPSNGAINSPEM